MRALVSALVVAAIIGGIMHASGLRSSETTNQVLTAHINSTQDPSPAIPGPTDPNGPST
jgi:hypothetical protein